MSTAIVMAAAAVCCTALAFAAEPLEARDRVWLITSLLSGSRLANRNIFDLAFEAGPSGSIKFIWLASSDGLHRYDGYEWRHYGKSDGLPSNFVRCVLVTRSGALWVGTDSGAGVFDGKSFSRQGSERGLAGQNVRRMVEDPDGAIWFCSDSWPKANGGGGLAELRGGGWRSWHEQDGLPSEYVVNYFRSSDGRRFVVTSGGLAQMEGGRFSRPLLKLARPGLNWGSAALAESPASGLMVSTGTDVFVSKGGKWKLYSDTVRHEHGIAATADGKIIACGGNDPNQKFFVEWAGDRWKQVSATFPLTHDYIENLREGPDGSIYAIGFDCFRRWQRRGSEWRVYSGMPRPVSAGSDGSVWSLDSRGFYRSKNGNWRKLGPAAKGLLPVRDGFWSWNTRALTHWKQPLFSVPGEARTGLTNYQNVNVDRLGNPWAYGWDGANRRKVVHLLNGHWIEIPLTDALWAVGTPDPVSGMWYLAYSQHGGSKLLKLDDGHSEAFPVPAALISQYANFLHADRRGNVWLMGDTGLHRWRKENASSWEKIAQIQGASVAGCFEDGDALWFIVDGTLGGKSGLALFSNGGWKNFDTDPIFSWSLAKDRLLLGSKGKFYIVPSRGDSPPAAVGLPEPEPVIGALQDRSGSYWLGTPQGTFLFCPLKSTPETTVVSFDPEVLEGRSVRGRVRGFSRFNPSAPASNFTYSWRLDDGRWSPFTAQQERSFGLRGLEVGTHHLWVRARDNSLNIDPSPADITFRVLQLPLQGRRWFRPALVAIGALLVALTITAAAARFKLSRQAAKLEEMVEARTAELKLREEELHVANRALQRTNDDLRQFSWAASHDLQEPLRMVVTYTQFLAKRYTGTLDETGRQFMSYAVDGAYRAQSLLQALLEYWQVSEGGEDTATITVDSGVALKKALTNLEIRMLESGAVVTCSALPSLVASEVALVQVFQNLVSNAIKYSKPGVSPQIEIWAEPRGDEWLFMVKDHGIGIAEEHRHMIFELFKRLDKNRYAGTGVGLALCAKIVANLGGKIWVESEVGSGSTFYFSVPARERKQ